ncbi:murein hydrolase activator EnvC family protein [Lacihabitans soyangensis]|uniref:Peptidase M23 n=1 Tax=Lacihabitans soyangensis TaxID=869394 RepID=A0AAE3H1A4_9BACT|nr:peptidoglycan DD-metalloendopeptidase family protein [Lacihabitans soyangensis]MCP9762807.1 peptidase M23 [Lacihabitans soyangensis]
MKKYFLLIFTICITLVTFAQKQKSRATLEAEKKRNLQKIAQVKKILSETQKEKESTIGQIKAINQQIENQQNKIELAKEDIELIKVEMAEIEKAQADLFKQLKSLQTEYSETIYRESKNSNKLTKMGFLFSSSSVSELFMRYKYLEQYTENRKHQLLQIKKIGEMLKQRQRTLLEKKITQQNLINIVKIEAKSLEALKEKQNLIVKDLNNKESDLKTELEKSNAALSSLNSVISKAIEKEQNARKVLTTKKVPESRKEKQAEIEEREKKILSERENKKNSKAEVIAEKTENKASRVGNHNFGAQKAKLSWPVDGFVSDKFGVKNHPVLKGLKVDNNGIDIQASPNAAVRAVFEGVVLDISQIPGLNNVVAIQHGDYYTVYANLQNVNVSINQQVNLQQQIGTVAYKDGSPEINFQIWHNFSKLNPEPWLGSK